MGLQRIETGLRAALNATAPDPDDRYQAAMIRRAKEILTRAAQLPDPEDALSAGSQDLARLIRARDRAPLTPLDLRTFVEAKLNILNPDFKSEDM